jgi:type IX secretion system PorP/SprF family membrane protein
MIKQIIKAKKMKNILILPAFFLSGSALFAQDLHFSQYQQTPSLINPALTGASTVIRASVIYKDQWRSVTVPYKTYGASFEMKFKASNWEKADKFKTKTYKKSFSRMAGGLSFYRDKAGDGNMGSTQANLTLATFVPLSKHSSLSVGLQASIVQQSVNVSKLVFPNQYGATGYDPTINSNENYATQNFIYPDFAGGINWSYGFNEKSIGANTERRANVGISMYHINQPKQLYLDDSKERLSSKYIFHADYLYGIRNSNVALIPSFIATLQGPSLEMIEGFMIKYYFKEDSKYTGIIKRSGLGFGIAYRNGDAAILSVLLEYENYAAGVSYDLNTSKLTQATTGRGGPEFFIRFVTPNPFLYQKSRARFN